ncbi:hypothetical protein [Castellaniella sp.]|uniref:hypothetical protein n=1 Tax=Castellaniella sp. TaxID=1955812 RepID=UPI003C77D656
MSPLISIAPTLPEDTVLYRTMDFFSAAAMCSSMTLMFSRADTFSDRNEGIDRLLTQLELTQPGSGCGMGWSDAETARRMHDRVKQSHYISCWSRNAESVAMWALYSPDHCSVRVSTTVSKLLPAVENLASKYSLLRLNSSDLGKRVAVAVMGSIEPVTYENLADISHRIGRRAKARQRLDERYERMGRERPSLTEINPRYWEREEQRRFSDVRTTCRLKDASFSHEAEVRLSVRIGEETFSANMLDDQAMFEPTHQYHSLLKENFRFWGWISTVQIPEHEFVNCSVNLVESVAIDPRCPPHKAHFMATWFRERGIRVVNSTCFGYLPNTFPAFPDK